MPAVGASTLFLYCCLSDSLYYLDKRLYSWLIFQEDNKMLHNEGLKYEIHSSQANQHLPERTVTKLVEFWKPRATLVHSEYGYRKMITL
jgi:hypothetical protein